MIIYMAGSGYKCENSPFLLQQKNKNWGILLSYKDHRTKTGKPTKRFANLIKRK